MLHKNDIFYVLENSVDMMASVIVERCSYKELLREFERGFNEKYALVVRELLKCPIPHIIGANGKRVDAIKVAAILKHSIKTDNLHLVFELLNEKDIKPFERMMTSFSSYSAKSRVQSTSSYIWFREKEMLEGVRLADWVFTLWLMADSSMSDGEELNNSAVCEMAAFVSVSLSQNEIQTSSVDTIVGSLLDNARFKGVQELNDNFLHKMLDQSGSSSVVVPCIPQVLDLAFRDAGLNFGQTIPNMLTKRDISLAKNISLECLYHENEDREPENLTAHLVENHLDALRVYDINTFIVVNTLLMARKLEQEIKKNLALEIFGGQEETGRDAFLEHTVESLEHRVSELEQELQSLSKQKSSLEERLISAKNREAALMIQMQKALNQEEETGGIQEPEQVVEPEPSNTVPEIDFLESQQGNSDGVDYTEEINHELEEKNVVFVGGNTNLIKKLRQLHPKIVFVQNDAASFNSDLMRNCDLAIVKTDSCSHKLYKKMKCLALQHRIPYFYMSNISAIPLVQKELLEYLKKANGSA